MEDILALHHHIAKLERELEVAEETIRDQGRRNSNLMRENDWLKEQINDDMRGMQQQSDSPRGSERGNVPGALHELHVRGAMRRACSGD